MESKMECPWCDQELSLSEEEYQGPNGKMRIKRCAQCHSIISIRLEGEPDEIIKKG